jgi:hypothetical protein
MKTSQPRSAWIAPRWSLSSNSTRSSAAVAAIDEDLYREDLARTLAEKASMLEAAEDAIAALEQALGELGEQLDDPVMPRVELRGPRYARWAMRDRDVLDLATIGVRCEHPSNGVATDPERACDRARRRALLASRRTWCTSSSRVRHRVVMPAPSEQRPRR